MYGDYATGEGVRQLKNAESGSDVGSEVMDEMSYGEL